MVEVPALLYQDWNETRPNALDFISVGSNDLFQFLFAVDRGNSQSDRSLRHAVCAHFARALLRDIVVKSDRRQEERFAVRRNGVP
jgi:phosphotransferase system enzyme I (PtsP)